MESLLDRSSLRSLRKKEGDSRFHRGTSQGEVRSSVRSQKRLKSGQWCKVNVPTVNVLPT